MTWSDLDWQRLDWLVRTLAPALLVGTDAMYIAAPLAHFSPIVSEESWPQAWAWKVSEHCRIQAFWAQHENGSSASNDAAQAHAYNLLRIHHMSLTMSRTTSKAMFHAVDLAFNLVRHALAWSVRSLGAEAFTARIETIKAGMPEVLLAQREATHGL
jgi:hypothetical protein